MNALVEKKSYRPDIDGLRAVAVLGVVAFHLDETYLPGGFLGVDVFFVISGYLITSIIQRSVERGDFSYVRFYERRIKRLMPALFLMITLVGVPVVLWMWPIDFEAYGKSIKYVMISLANLHFLDYIDDYFGGDAKQVPLLHTWSLAVEEQYYLLFPPALIGLNRLLKKRKDLMIAVAIMLAMSLSVCIWRGDERPMSSFFLLPYRAWELLAGSLMALWVMKPMAMRLSRIVGFLGLALVILSFIMIGEGNLIPGLAAVPACLGTVLLIRAGADHSVGVSRLLSLKPLVAIGLISYSLYLWHWPLIVFREQILPVAGHMGNFVIFCLSLVFGWLSWKFVEQPFRLANFRRRGVFGTWAALTLVMVVASQWIRKENGFPSRYPAEVRTMLEFGEKDPEFRLRTKENYDPSLAPVYGDRSKSPEIAVWGDSHAEALLPVLHRMGMEKGKSFRIYMIPGQIPVPRFVVKDRDNDERDRYTRDVYRKLLTDPSIRTVVLHARWGKALWGQNENGREILPNYYNRTFDGREHARSELEASLRSVVTSLIAAGKRVVLIYPVPEMSVHVPRMLAKFIDQGQPVPEYLPSEDFERRCGDFVSWFDSYPPSPQLVRIKPHMKLYRDGQTKVSHEGMPLYRDDDHLGKPGGEYISDLLVPVFETLQEEN